MRSPLHSICPYFAMFPETFVKNQLLAYTQPGSQILDGFCGRGTTVLESLLNDRHALGCDINPVAACVAGAKADVPRLEETLRRLANLEGTFRSVVPKYSELGEFFHQCFHPDTMPQILFLRENLAWRTDRTDRFIAAVLLGVLHGESHKTMLCLSNRMPRTISTKPQYSVKWWRDRGLLPPRRDAFAILKRCCEYRLAGSPPTIQGKVVLCDVRNASKMLEGHRGSVSLIVTSPPYLDTTDYAEDQWLRLWFLGGPSAPTARLHKDDRHTIVENYWGFLAQAWVGIAPLLNKEAHVVIRIGGTLLAKYKLFDGLSRSLQLGIKGRDVKPLHDGETTIIRRRQTNSFRPGTSPLKVEHDFAFAVS